MRLNLFAILSLLVLCQALARPVSLLPQESWQPGRLLSAELVATLTPQEVQARSAPAFGSSGLPIIENAVEIWELTLSTTGPDGEQVPVAAQLFVPVEPARGPSPLLVYGSGTTGIGPACAPSREALLSRPLGAYRQLLAPYAGRGIVTVLPDYLGFDDPDRPQAYFHAISETRVLLDASRAVNEFFLVNGRGSELQEATFFAGYSQGGHAAFAVADNYLDYAPEVPLTGVMGFAATTDVQALLGEAAYYAPYIVLAWQAIYGPLQIDPADIFAARWLPTLESNALVDCVDRAQQVYPLAGSGLYTPEFNLALLAGDVSSVSPGFASALAANNTGLSGHGIPALVVQGGQDIIVSDAVQERFVAALCAAGGPVEYLNYPAARHRDTRAAGFDASIAWMRTVLDPEVPVPDNCP